LPQQIAFDLAQPKFFAILVIRGQLYALQRSEEKSCLDYDRVAKPQKNLETKTPRIFVDITQIAFPLVGRFIFAFPEFIDLYVATFRKVDFFLWVLEAHVET
jgi:hypothetical protein